MNLSWIVFVTSTNTEERKVNQIDEKGNFLETFLSHATQMTADSKLNENQLFGEFKDKSDEEILVELKNKTQDLTEMLRVKLYNYMTNPSPRKYCCEYKITSEIYEYTEFLSCVKDFESEVEGSLNAKQLIPVYKDRLEKIQACLGWFDQFEK
ncbi:hypothetical protein TUBRATIS_13440 [Tubulinosema ratisbonensis]|uniref:Uncharacterized protein n=1 Tax=Tubulinosema ratisbonensis TaxID=291195 RepID=A0A437ALX7_9MICR|nr:hypothetical protein TUBRATIS_13440 [Tubulinosema ratisbonensis]